MAEVIGGVSIEIVGDYSGLQSDLDAAQSLAQSAGAKIADALDIGTPDTAPVTQALQQISDVATSTGQSIATALEVQVAAPDVSAVVDSFTALQDSATATASAITSAFSGESIPVPDISGFTDALALADEDLGKLEADYLALEGSSAGVVAGLNDVSSAIQQESAAAIDGQAALQVLIDQLKEGEIGGKEFISMSNALAGALEAAGVAAAGAGTQFGAGAEGEERFSLGAQNLIDKQAELDGRLAQSISVLGEIHDAYVSGSVGADTLAQAEKNVEDAIRAAGSAASEGAASSRLFSDGVQAIVDVQGKLDSELENARAVLSEMQAAYNAGAVSAESLARAEAGVESALAAANPAIKESGDDANAASTGLESMVSALAAIGTALAITAGLKDFGEAALKAFGEEQQVTIGLTQLSGSAEVAAAAMDTLKQQANDAGISQDALLKTAQRLAAQFGEGEGLAGVLKAAENAAAATGRSVDTIAASLERVDVAGAVNTKTLINLGLSWQDLAKTMGVSIEEAQATLKKGGQDAASDVQALVDAINSKFKDAAAAQGASLIGMFNTFKNELDDLLQDIGKSIAPAIEGLISIFNTSILPVLQGIIQGFEDLPGPIQEVAVVIALAAAAVAPLAAGLGAIGLAIAAAQTAIPAFTSLIESLGLASAATAAEEEAAAIATGHLGEAAALASGESGIGGLASGAALAEGALGGLVGVIGVGLLSAVVGAAAAFSDLKTVMADTEAAAAKTNDAFQKWLGTLASAAESIQDIQAAQDKVKQSLDAGAISAGQATTLLNGLEKATRDLTAAQNEAIGNNFNKYLSDIGITVTTLGQSMSTAQATTEASSISMGRLRDAVGGAQEKLVAAVEAYNRVRDAGGDLTKSALDVANAQDGVTHASQQLQSSLDYLAKQANATLDAFEKYAQARPFASISDDAAVLVKAEANALAAHQAMIAEIAASGQTVHQFWANMLADAQFSMNGAIASIPPLITGIQSINDPLHTAAQSAKDAQTAFESLFTVSPAPLDAIAQAMKTFGVNSQGAKATVADMAAALPGLIAGFDAGRVSLDSLDASLAKESQAIGKMAKEDLPSAIAAWQTLIDKVGSSDLPNKIQLISQYTTQMMQDQIRWGEQTGQSVAGIIINLENLRLKNEQVKSSADGWGAAYITSVKDIQSAFDSINKGIADIIVSGKNLQDVFAGIWKSFATQELNLLISQTLKPIEQSFLNIGNAAGSAGKVVGESAAQAADGMKAESAAVNATIDGTKGLSNGMDGLSSATKGATSGFASFATTLGGAISLMAAAFEGGKLLGGALKDLFSGPSSLNITSYLPIAGLSGSQVSQLAQSLGLDLSAGGNTGLGTQQNPGISPGTSPSAETTAAAIGQLTAQIQRLTELQTGLNNEMVAAYAKGNLDLGNKLAADLQVVAQAIQAEQGTLDSINASTQSTTIATTQSAASTQQMATAMQSAAAQLDVLKSQQASLQNQLIDAEAAGNTALVASLTTQLGTVNSSISSQSSLIQGVTAAVQSVAPDIVTAVNTLQSALGDRGALAGTDQMIAAIVDLEQSIAGGDIASIDRATAVLQQLLIKSDNSPAVVDAIIKLQDAIASGDNTAIAAATTALQGTITSTSNSATAQLATAEKEFADAIVTGNTAAIAKAAGDIQTALAANAKASADAIVAGLPAGMKASADEIATAIKSQQDALSALQSHQADLQQELLIELALGNTDIVNAIQAELAKVGTQISGTNSTLTQLQSITQTGSDNVVTGLSGVQASAVQIAIATANAQTSVDNLKAQLLDLDQQLIIAEASGNDKLVATLQSQIGTTNSELSTASGILSQIQTNTAASNNLLANGITGAQATSGQTSSAVNNLTAAINNERALIADLNQQLIIAVANGDMALAGQITAAIGTLNGQISTNTGLLGTVAGSITGAAQVTGTQITSAVASINAQIHTDNDRLAALHVQLIAATASGNQDLIKVIQGEIGNTNSDLTAANTLLSQLTGNTKPPVATTTGGAAGAASTLAGTNPVGSNMAAEAGASGIWDAAYQIAEISKRISDNEAQMAAALQTNNQKVYDELAKENATLSAQLNILQNPDVGASQAIKDLEAQITSDTQSLITAQQAGDMATAKAFQDKVDQELAQLKVLNDTVVNGVSQAEKDAIALRTAALAQEAAATTSAEKIAALVAEITADNALAAAEAKAGNATAATGWKQAAIDAQNQINAITGAGKETIASLESQLAKNSAAIAQALLDGNIDLAARLAIESQNIAARIQALQPSLDQLVANTQGLADAIGAIGGRGSGQPSQEDNAPAGTVSTGGRGGATGSGTATGGIPTGREPQRSFDTGGYVDQDMVAQVHQGENVLTGDLSAELSRFLASQQAASPMTTAAQGVAAVTPALTAAQIAAAGAASKAADLAAAASSAQAQAGHAANMAALALQQVAKAQADLLAAQNSQRIAQMAADYLTGQGNGALAQEMADSAKLRVDEFAQNLATAKSQSDYLSKIADQLQSAATALKAHPAASPSGVMEKPGIEMNIATALTQIANGPMNKTPIQDPAGSPVKIVAITAEAAAFFGQTASAQQQQSGPSQQDLLAASMAWLDAQQGITAEQKAISAATYQSDAKAGLLPSPGGSGSSFSGYNPYSTPVVNSGQQVASGAVGGPKDKTPIFDPASIKPSGPMNKTPIQDVPSFDIGGFINRDMLAMVHAGEWVIPNAGKIALPPEVMARIQMPNIPGAPNVPNVPFSTGSSGGTGDSFTFIIQGITDPDLLAREISSRIKTRTGRTAKFSN